MKLTPEQLDLIRESLRWLRPEVDRVAGEFYEDLFRRDPKMRDMFRPDITGQGMKFMSAINVVVDNMDDPEALDREIDLLASGHAGLPIKEMDYHTMEEALIDTFRYAMGERFTRNIQLAWRSAFQQIAQAMREKSKG